MAYKHKTQTRLKWNFQSCGVLQILEVKKTACQNHKYFLKYVHNFSMYEEDRLIVFPHSFVKRGWKRVIMKHTKKIMFKLKEIFSLLVTFVSFSRICADSSPARKWVGLLHLSRWIQSCHQWKEMVIKLLKWISWNSAFNERRWQVDFS